MPNTAIKVSHFVKVYKLKEPDHISFEIKKGKI